MVIDIFRKDKVYSPMGSIGEYTVLKKIGEGRYGITYLVTKNNKFYILKQLKKKMLKLVGNKVNYEKEILSKIDHAKVPKLLDILEINDYINYVLEFKEGKTFEEIIFKDNYVFSRKEIFDITLQLIDILKYLHARGIVHRDIRVPNVILNNGNVSLVDFGLARWIDNKRYKFEVDFHYLADFILHLYYTSFDKKGFKGKPWYEELPLNTNERVILERLFGMKNQYKDIKEVEEDFLLLKE